MIRIAKKASAPVPAILATDGIAASDSLKHRFDGGERLFKSEDFNSDIYGHKDVKDALILTQNGKCCFCESKILHISHGDVEHFRPKTGWVQNVEALNKPGYYWLAYDWNNLFLSCEKCNQRHKRNLFPLINPAHRALSHLANIKKEQPLFIHPAKENPEDFISFKDEIPVAINANNRGTETIIKLGLDRELLNDQRREKLNPIRQIYNLAKGIPETLPDLKAEARDAINHFYQSSLKDDTEYASMLRSFFKDNPIIF